MFVFFAPSHLCCCFCFSLACCFFLSLAVTKSKRSCDDDDDSGSIMPFHNSIINVNTALCTNITSAIFQFPISHYYNSVCWLWLLLLYIRWMLCCMVSGGFRWGGPHVDGKKASWRASSNQQAVNASSRSSADSVVSSEHRARARKREWWVQERARTSVNGRMDGWAYDKTDWKKGEHYGGNGSARANGNNNAIRRRVVTFSESLCAHTQIYTQPI